jgi:adenylate kinase
MKMILLGPPGAGKGTQGDFIAAEFGIPKVSTGDMLRAAVKAHTAIGIQAEAIMKSGGLVSDDIILGIIAERLKEPDCAHGVLFDGFPRTIEQAQGLRRAGVEIDVVLELLADDEGIVRRMSGRRAHLASGRTYHVEFNPPRVPDRDDVTNEPLVQRADDKEETVRNRLVVYKRQTEPLVAFYQDLRKQLGDAGPHYIRVDGNRNVEEVKEVIIAKLREVVGRSKT